MPQVPRVTPTGVECTCVVSCLVHVNMTDPSSSVQREYQSHGAPWLYLVFSVNTTRTTLASDVTMIQDNGKSILNRIGGSSSEHIASILRVVTTPFGMNGAST